MASLRRRRARKLALRAAVRQAKADAETVAEELGWKKFSIVSVADGPSSGLPAEPTASRSRIPAGEIAVSARVTLKCVRDKP